MNTVNPPGSSRISPPFKVSRVTSSISSTILIPCYWQMCPWAPGIRAWPPLEEEYILFTIKFPVHTELVQIVKWHHSIPWTSPSHLFEGWAIISLSHAFVPRSMFAEQDYRCTLCPLSLFCIFLMCFSFSFSLQGVLALLTSYSNSSLLCSSRSLIAQRSS